MVYCSQLMMACKSQPYTFLPNSVLIDVTVVLKADHGMVGTFTPDKSVNATNQNLFPFFEELLIKNLPAHHQLQGNED